MNLETCMDKNYAYVDGSFNQKTRVYGCGVILFDQNGKKHTEQHSGSNTKMAKLESIAGEILGAKKAVSLALKLGMRELTIFHDNIGIGAWADGVWSTNLKETREYHDFIQRTRERGLNIRFQKVKGHSRDVLNDLADSLARNACGLSDRR